MIKKLQLIMAATLTLLVLLFLLPFVNWLEREEEKELKQR